MRDELLTYYERELGFIRRMTIEFGEKYPKIASRLQLERGKCDDPHVERLIESFALLAARVHLKIDDEFPEITQALLQVLYPHYLQPVPSMSIVRFELDPDQGRLSKGYPIPRHQPLYSRTTSCEFRTCYPVVLWPVKVAEARLDVPGPTDGSGRAPTGTLTLKLRTNGETLFSELEIETLRFFLEGDDLANRLYESIFGRCYRIELRDPSQRRSPVALPNPSVAEVGFGRDEGLLPYSPRSFLGYRLLQEYFQFPQKYLFVDVLNLRALRQSGFHDEVDLTFFFDGPGRIDQPIAAGNFQLGCTPIVNLFERGAEPISLDHAHTEYRVIPDIRAQRAMEVYSVDSVKSISPETGAEVEFQPFYSYKHSFGRQKQHAFWHATRRPSEKKDDEGTEVYLTLVDLHLRPTVPATDVLTVGVTCTNRGVAGELPFRVEGGDFDMEGSVPVKPAVCLMKPTKTLRPPLGHRSQWRLISHLSLNYLSPVDGGEDRDPRVLREILQLYDFSDEADVQKQIRGIVGVSSRQVMRRIRSDFGSGFARGIEATLEFDEKQYVGSGLYLFSSVLEKFLGLYVSINSFSELVAKTERGVFKRWPPRTGSQVLL